MPDGFTGDSRTLVKKGWLRTGLAHVAAQNTKVKGCSKVEICTLEQPLS